MTPPETSRTGDSDDTRLLSRRRLLASCASLTALGGCVGGQSLRGVSLATKSEYFDSVALADNQSILSDRLTVTLADDRPDGMDYVVLLQNGKQEDVEEWATGESNIILTVAEMGPEDSEDCTLVAVSGGEIKATFIGREHQGGEVLEKVDIKEDWK